MEDKPIPHSGSRCEPAPTPLGDQGPPDDAPGPASPVAHAPAADPRRALAVDPTRPPSRRFALRGRRALVAVATGIVALGGAGGYALGNAAADGTDQVGLVGLVGNGTGGGQSRLPGTPPTGVGNGTGVLPPGQDQDFDDDFDGDGGDFDRHGAPSDDYDGSQGGTNGSQGGPNGSQGGTNGGNGTDT